MQEPLNLSDLHEAFATGRYETARRIGNGLLSRGIASAELVLALHDVLIKLADFSAATRLLEDHSPLLEGFKFEKTFRLASDFRRLAEHSHYRGSVEAREGYSFDEYRDKYRRLSEQLTDQAKSLAQSETQKATLMEWETGKPAIKPIQKEQASQGSGALKGRFLMEDGSPAAGATVTIGLEIVKETINPSTFISNSMEYVPALGELKKATVITDDDGRFLFENLPAGKHEFLSITLDPLRYEIATRFIHKDIVVNDGKTVDLDTLFASTWQSAPAESFVSPHPETFEENGVKWEKCAEWKIRNHFHYQFPRQLLELTLPGEVANPRVRLNPNRDHPFQLEGQQLHLLTQLEAKSGIVIAVYDSEHLAPEACTTPLRLIRESDESWVIDTGVAQFRIAGTGAQAGAAPLQAVRAADGLWRGNGRFSLPNKVKITATETAVLVEGPLFICVQIDTYLSNGGSHQIKFTAYEGEPLLLGHEACTGFEGAAFEFSLSEFSGGRGFLLWNSENGSQHWSTLGAEDRISGLLPESIPWWIYPQGFGYAMTPEGLDEKDYIGIFTRNRGEWIDRVFHRISQGPMNSDGAPNYELDWPFPEMVGSSISMIQAKTSIQGDALFSFGFFDGERQWGVLASSLEKNDGPWKEFGRLQHAWSSPRLNHYKDWNLDEPDSVARPHLVATKEDLISLRHKTKNSSFERLWKKIKSQSVPGPRLGLLFAVEQDPLIAWREKLRLLAQSEIRSKMTLLGRDWSDMYSPVGGRNITKLAETYDLIAASGAFSDSEERQVRAFLILMGHLYMEPDFMNWKFNARNANFEADRTDIVGAIGLAFAGHPDSAKFIDHAVERTRSALIAYCTPGSGKWYENPACYYLHASKCRMNLIFHLTRKGILDLSSIPRLKEFLNWGILLLTPPLPVSYRIMSEGTNAEFESSPRTRKVPPIGDHAVLGRWLPEHYFLVGKLYRDWDPEFSKRLVHAYFLSNGDGDGLLQEVDSSEEAAGEGLKSVGSAFGNLPLLFSMIEESDIPQQPELLLASRRLEGFGALFRNRTNTAKENYLLIKQGPGGYRFHRTEGSFLFFAEGRPLVYDGGEAGETWRHSTLSFYDVHMPLSAGRVERYYDSGTFQFSQGVHPNIIAPGEPIFLSDSCEHTLVEECYRRFYEPNPAVVRSFAWVQNRYLVVHDALNIPETIPSHWHLQLVSDGDPVGSLSEGLLFKGRFGVDLQVQTPGFSTFTCEPLPVLEHQGNPAQWFHMAHLQVSSPAARDYLAILVPSAAGELITIQSERIIQKERVVGAMISSSESNDFLFFNRAGMEYLGKDFLFSGSYGAVLLASQATELLLLGSGRVERQPFIIESDGPLVSLRSRGDRAEFRMEGKGKVKLAIGKKSHAFKLVHSTPLTRSFKL